MKSNLSFVSVLLLVLSSVFVAQSAYAANKSAKSGLESEEIRQVVEKNVLEVLELFKVEREYYETDPDRFLKSMDGALNKIVDFRRIAARVMGKYARKASKDQRNRFVQVFKDSLYSTYTKTLIDSGVFDIKVTKAKLNSRSNKKAVVDMQVITDNGTVLPVAYSMYLDKQNNWMMENVIVFGVNIGLAFRDKFALQYRKNKGNLNSVIDGWNVDLDIKQPDGTDLLKKAENVAKAEEA
jgi:phospholipid transport system substrate-binding protein